MTGLYKSVPLLKLHQQNVVFRLKHSRPVPTGAKNCRVVDLFRYLGGRPVNARDGRSHVSEDKIGQSTGE